MERLEEFSRKSDSCLVAYSGGKDSRAVTDLCCRSFKRVVLFHLYFVPGMACVEEYMDYARKQWGVEVLYYPARGFIKCLRSGIYCDEPDRYSNLPELKLHDLYTWVMRDTGIPIIANGARNSDGFWRKRFFYATATWSEMLYPLKDWLLRDVIAYLRLRKIPIPAQNRIDSGNIDLGTDSLLWLHDNHPEDFKKLLAWFPYAEAVVWRRTFYGEKETQK